MAIVIDTWVAARTRPGAVVQFGCRDTRLVASLVNDGTNVVALVEDARLLTADACAIDGVDVRHAPAFPTSVAAASATTVLLGDLLAHELRPRPLIEETVRILAPEGIVLAWSPLGVRRHDGHLDAMPIDDVFAALEPLHVHHVDLVDGFLAIVAGTQPPAEPLEGPALHAVLEQHLAVRDRRVFELEDECRRLTADLGAAVAAREHAERALATARRRLEAERSTRSAKAIRLVRRVVRRVRRRR